jgi:hypothetical protein
MSLQKSKISILYVGFFENFIDNHKFENQFLKKGSERYHLVANLPWIGAFEIQPTSLLKYNNDSIE